MQEGVGFEKPPCQVNQDWKQTATGQGIDKFDKIFMGQKVHPLGFRLGITQEHHSQWFAHAKDYPFLMLEDRLLRAQVLSKFPGAGITSIGVQRKGDQVRVDICAARPRAIVAYGGQDLERLRTSLAETLQGHRQSALNLGVARGGGDRVGSQKAHVAVHLTKLSNPNVSAAFLSDFLVEQLEKRVPFRRAMKSAMRRAQRAQIKGIKIQVSGRLNGAEIARSEWLRKGRVPLHTLRARVDYNFRTASTIYGLLGIKVWTFHGLAEAKPKQSPLAS
jgi:small subunit ribosomal protein S3